jgi:hypothetical protein
VLPTSHPLPQVFRACIAWVKRRNPTRNTSIPSILYQIDAEDDSGFRSFSSSPMYGKALNEKSAERITLKAKAGNDEITLTWNIDTQKEIERVLIYKSIDGEPLRLHGNSTESSYIDRNLGFGKSIKYRIRVVYKDGTTSDFSNEASLN